MEQRAHAAGRLRGDRREDRRHQHLDRSARRSDDRSDLSDAVRCDRCQFAARPEYRDLCAGRGLTLNVGLRFDQLYQFVDANQFSPRAALVFKPVDGTTIHAGYARYFTPPMQAQATQSNLALFTNTTNQPEVPLNDPVLPERSHYFDVGVNQKVLTGLDIGVDAYYKIATDMLDDGQFGQAVVLTQFNWLRGYSEGMEFKLKYQNGDFKAYGNFAYGISRAIDATSNQYLLDAATYTY